MWSFFIIKSIIIYSVLSLPLVRSFEIIILVKSECYRKNILKKLKVFNWKMAKHCRKDQLQGENSQENHVNI